MARCMLLSQISVKKENGAKTAFQMTQSGDAAITWYTVKSSLFDIKHGKTQPVFKQLEIVYTYHRHVSCRLAFISNYQIF